VEAVTTASRVPSVQRRSPSPSLRLVGSRGRDLALGAAGVALVLVGWQLASVTGLLPADTVPSMLTVLSALGDLREDPVFWGDLQNTVMTWLWACVLTCVIALPVGLAIGTSRFVDDSTRTLVEFLKPIPPIALIPLGLLLWGPSATMKLTLVTFGAIWPLLIQVVYGVRAVDRVALAMARSYRLGRLQTLTRVVVPGISPYVVTGLRVSAAIALIVTIVVEMVGGVAGIGQGIVQTQNASALPRMYALIIVTGLMGVIVNGGFQALEGRLLRWHPSHRSEARR
jgi:ABC-type nitrate/sulfonate/bicarbonate transport system permease component